MTRAKWRKGKKKNKEKEEEKDKQQTKHPRLDNAFKDKPGLATLDLRRNFKGMATEAKKTTMDTSHTRTAFQRSATSERRHWRLSLGPSSLSSC